MLTQYQTDLKNLLQSPGAPTQLYSNTNLNRWINIARGQIAGEGECIRFYASIPTVINQRAYNFSSISTGVSATNGRKPMWISDVASPPSRATLLPGTPEYCSARERLV